MGLTPLQSPLMEPLIWQLALDHVVWNLANWTHPNPLIQERHVKKASGSLPLGEFCPQKNAAIH
jgi:hypothetical protein